MSYCLLVVLEVFSGLFFIAFLLKALSLQIPLQDLLQQEQIRPSGALEQHVRPPTGAKH